MRDLPDVICISRAICCRSDIGVFGTDRPELPDDEEIPRGPDRDDCPGIFVIASCKEAGLIENIPLNWEFEGTQFKLEIVGFGDEMKGYFIAYREINQLVPLFDAESHSLSN